MVYEIPHVHCFCWSRELWLPSYEVPGILDQACHSYQSQLFVGEQMLRLCT